MQISAGCKSTSDLQVDIICFSAMIHQVGSTYFLTLLHSEWPKLHRVLAILSAAGLIKKILDYAYHADNIQYSHCLSVEMMSLLYMSVFALLLSYQHLILLFYSSLTCKLFKELFTFSGSNYAIFIFAFILDGSQL